MGVPKDLPTVDVPRAKEIWAEYQRQHDVSALIGQVVGIDPASGAVYFGESATEIGNRLRAEGRHVPLFFSRVGSATYQRKGGRR
jgi:hypothetical protein